METILDMNRIANRLDRLEATIEKLVIVMQTIENNKNTTRDNADHHEPVHTDPPSELLQTTKKAKDKFYRLYGALKNNKNQFTKD